MDTDEKLSGLCLSSETKTNGIGETALCVVVGLLTRLKKFPESGRPLPEFPELSFREVIVSPYRFFYKVKDNNVWIVAVWHGAQLPDEPEKIG